MSWDIRDRYLWLGFGAFLFVAIKGISQTLRTTIRLSEVYDPDHAKAANDIQAEDSISLDALATLVTSPNQDISSSATSLILSRFTQDPSACKTLTTDLFSSTPSTRHKAKEVLYLFDSLSLDLYPFDDASVSNLHDKSDRRLQHACQAYFYATRKYRQGRLNSLVQVAEMVEDSMRAGQSVRRVRREAVESHFVFPGQGDESGEEGEMMAARFQPVSQRVESLVDMLAEQAVTTRPLVRFASSGEQSTASSTTSELPALEEVDPNEDTAGSARLRRHAQSNHEAEARRRRREAMVLHEGGGRIGMEDIHHPRTDGRS
ncbi:hypothetical protein VTO58DRAFT_107010 [Aureobasidium pullulans]